MLEVLLICLVWGVIGQSNDQTRVPGSSGHAVVEASLDLISETCIFKNDRLFFRRVAYVETNDGDSSRTYRPGYNGGIWQVSQNMFQVTKSSSTRPFLRHQIVNISRDLNVNWDTTNWSDLRKPLYSSIAARLYIAYQARGVSSGIPISTNDQANFWKTYYNPAGDVNDFKTKSARLEIGCKGRGIDLSFVVDGSGSIGSNNFDKIKDFIKEVIKAFDIGGDKTRIGVIQYSSLSYIELYFNRYFTQSSVLGAVDRINYRGGGTNTHLAMHQLRNILYQVSNGARPKNQSHPRVAVVLTDGRSNYALTSAAARRVHAEDITVLSIGVGSNFNMNELKAIASAPVCMHLSLLKDFTEIDSLKHTIQKRSCDAPTIIGGGGFEEVIPPSGSQNCKIRIPPSGATVKVLAMSGSVIFYIARDKYPNAAYYDRKIESNGYGAALYIPSMNGTNGDTFCNIEGGNNTSNNITVGVDPGDREWCRSSPCQNDGDCVDDGDQGYRCICPSQYEGTNCQDRISPCRGISCRNGATCVVVGNNYQCRCRNGYEGTWCQNKIPPCRGVTCQNGGTCREVGDRYECRCRDDYEGSLCQTKIPKCRDVTCQNGGTCVENGNNYQCRCRDGYEGNFCQNETPTNGYNCNNKNPCTDDNKKNNRFYHPHEDPSKFVQCSQWGHCFEMNCPSGLVWDDEATTCNRPRIPRCRGVTCQNGGTCVENGSDYQCRCRDGYEGNLCQNRIPKCRSVTCQNGGTCVENGSDYQCRCRDGYEGKLCQNTGGSEGGYDCGSNNPCTKENIDKNRFYHPHKNPNKFVQCSQWGQCFVMPCPSNLVWDHVAYTCNRP